MNQSTKITKHYSICIFGQNYHQFIHNVCCQIGMHRFNENIMKHAYFRLWPADLRGSIPSSFVFALWMCLEHIYGEVVLLGVFRDVYCVSGYLGVLGLCNWGLCIVRPLLERCMLEYGVWIWTRSSWWHYTMNGTRTRQPSIFGPGGEGATGLGHPALMMSSRW